MKTILFILISIYSNAQVIDFDFGNLNNKPVQESFINNKFRFIRSLRQFDNHDSITIVFNKKGFLSNSYIMVKHNLIDANKIKLLYINFMIYCSIIHIYAPSHRMYIYSVYVKSSDNHYYKSDYQYPKISNHSFRIRDKSF